MRYVDAGYVVALVVLVLYALSLLGRRRRLERAASRGLAAPAAGPGAHGRAGVGARDTAQRDEVARADEVVRADEAAIRGPGR